MTHTVEDVLAIQQLVARYNFAVDSGDGAAFAATFTDDGALLNGDDRITGHDTLATFAGGLGAALPKLRHVVTNILVDGQGDDATLRAYLQLYINPGDGTKVATSGTYDDRLRRVDGNWLFVERHYIAD